MITFAAFRGILLGMTNKLKIGWREWVGLPEFEVAALKAKVDTGARTSSLHALDPEPFSDRGMSFVRFMLLPVQDTLIFGRVVTAPMVDRRRVTDSGGHWQERYVVHLNIQLGPQLMPIEVTLANRRDMRFRMLLGRQALQNVSIDPAESYLLQKTAEQKKFLKEIKAEVMRASK